MRFTDFSEFSYGYALTDNLVHGCFPGIIGAPVFPSLYAEGLSSGGYDLQLPLNGVAFFLQFKIPQVVRRRGTNCHEGFSLPYFRMHLRPGKHSRQHEALRAHQAAGAEVYYVAPIFHRLNELNSLYLSREVPEHTAYFLPDDIGELDGEDHYVAYDSTNQTAYLHSTPRPLKGPKSLREFRAAVLSSIDRATYKQDPSDFFGRIIDMIMKAASESGVTSDQADETIFKRQGSLARTAAYLARTYLDCELLILGRPEPGPVR